MDGQPNSGEIPIVTQMGPYIKFLSLLAVLFYVYQVTFALPTNEDPYLTPNAVITNSKCAIATFVDMRSYDDIYNAISLATSLRNVHVSAYPIAVVYGYNNDNDVLLLKNAGWNIYDPETNYAIDHGDLPGIKDADPQHHMNYIMEYIMARFFVFSLDAFNIVVYLDNNAVVTANIDELCSVTHATIGGVTHTRPHDIGLMTLMPDKSLYKAIENLVLKGDLTEPREIFDVFYNDRECPYFDPLKTRTTNLDNAPCVRLPVRYNGDVIYEILDTWIDNEQDKPKVIHYSLPGMKPWSWWSNIIVPDFWVWISGYQDIIEKTRTQHDPAIIIWIGKTVVTFFVLYMLPGPKEALSKLLFGWVFWNHPVPHPSLIKLFAFHIVNLIAMMFSFYWTNDYTMHPFLNLFLAILTLTGLVDVFLFMHINERRNYYRVSYFVLMLTFFSLFFNTVLIPSDFVLRLLLIVVWIVIVHGIYFTFLLMRITYTRTKLKDDDDNRSLPQMRNQTLQAKPYTPGTSDTSNSWCSYLVPMWCKRWWRNRRQQATRPPAITP